MNSRGQPTPLIGGTKGLNQLCRIGLEGRSLSGRLPPTPDGLDEEQCPALGRRLNPRIVAATRGKV
jgi:hypothetical protein